ncbi:MAG: hypothetical protein MJ078_05115, partial [Clostridia bacterium]|nr:hypothetical protein [Clostridia bacterium]
GDAMTVLRLDIPELFWINTGVRQFNCSASGNAEEGFYVSEITVTVKSKADFARREGDLFALYQRAKGEALEEVSRYAATLEDADPRVAKLKAINHYLAENTVYNKTDAFTDTPLGALVYGEALCEGYAGAFRALAQENGLTVVSVVGDSVSDGQHEKHMWSAALLDGKYYAIDATWNDTPGINEEEFFLVGNDTVYDVLRFSQSHLPDSTLRTDHQWIVPAIQNTAYQPTADAR